MSKINWQRVSVPSHAAQRAEKEFTLSLRKVANARKQSTRRVTVWFPNSAKGYTFRNAASAAKKLGVTIPQLAGMNGNGRNKAGIMVLWEGTKKKRDKLNKASARQSHVMTIPESKSR